MSNDTQWTPLGVDVTSRGQVIVGACTCRARACWEEAGVKGLLERLKVLRSVVEPCYPGLRVQGNFNTIKLAYQSVNNTTSSASSSVQNSLDTKRLARIRLAYQSRLSTTQLGLFYDSTLSILSPSPLPNASTLPPHQAMAGTPQRQLQASVIPVLYPKTDIEKRKIDITDYAKEFCSRNRKQGKLITRRDVEWYWEGNIRAEYDTVDPAHNWLISQIRCPKFQAFWINTAAPLAVREERLLQQQQQGFWPLRPNAKERKHFGSALILGNHTQRWIIPHVSLMAVEDVDYEDFVHDVRKANGEALRGSMVFHLWGALIKKAYDFVPKEVQTEKLKEVRSTPLGDHCTNDVDLCFKAFSGFAPTTEAGLEEFFGMSSKKRRSAPESEDDTSKDEHPERTQKRKRVSVGGTHSKCHHLTCG